MNKLLISVSVFFIVFPRTTIAYLFYIVASILLIKLNSKKSFIQFLLFVGFILVAYILNSSIYKVSPSGFLIEMALLLPLILYSSGFNLRSSNKVDHLRLLNFIVFLLSLLSLIKMGFPLKLPYVDFAPDYYFSLYGLGGAKIVTVIGFIGLLSEINRLEEFKKNAIKPAMKDKILLAICLSNFLMPSYILGIICGAIGLIPYIRKSPKMIIGASIAASLIVPYIMYRLSTLGFVGILDLPKIAALNALVDLYINYPHTMLIGTSVGQFISQSALWSSPYIAAISTHSIPNIPFFYMSEFHHFIFGPLLSVQDSFWDLSSSAQKPYSSIIGLFGEFGILFTLALLFSIFKRLKSFENVNLTFSVILFSVSIFLLDVWHDNLFFIYALMALETSQKAMRI